MVASSFLGKVPRISASVLILIQGAGCVRLPHTEQRSELPSRERIDRIDPVFRTEAVLEGCDSAETSNVLGALAILSDFTTLGFGDFCQCLDDAYLVEHHGKTGHEIASMYVSARIAVVECTDLEGNILGEAPVGIARGRLKIDDDYAGTGSARAIASTIAHELAHNFGFQHEANPFGSPYYGNTVPEQVEACVRDGAPNAWPGPGSQVVHPDSIAGMGIDGQSDLVFTWYRDGTVTAGTPTRLHAERIPTLFALPLDKTASDIVGMGIDEESKWVFAWYRDGTASAGTPHDLTACRPPYVYTLPPGKTPNDIVGMGMDGVNDLVYAFYRDGTASAGTTDDLSSRRSPYRFALPAGKQAADIVGVGIDGENGYVFAWYRDGTVTAGTPENLLLHRPPVRFEAGR